MKEEQAVFQTGSSTYYPDTCEGLRKAAGRNDVELEAYVHGDYPGTPFPDEVLPSVQTVGYWNSLQEQQWGLPWHRNEGIEITFLENGHLDFFVGNQQKLLVPNTLTITRPWQPHKLGNPTIGLCKLHWVIIDVGVRRPHQQWKWPEWILLSPSEKEELTILLSHNEKPVWENMQAIQQEFHEIGKIICKQHEMESFTFLTLKLNELCYRLLNLLKEIQPPLKKRLTSNSRNLELFLDELETEPEQPWTIESMARECGLGKTAFMEYFKRVTNMTPSQYLNYVRVKKGKKLLENEKTLSILDIAMECGFSSSQYFASIFKKYTGKTPSEVKCCQ